MKRWIPEIVTAFMLLACLINGSRVALSVCAAWMFVCYVSESVFSGLYQNHAEKSLDGWERCIDELRKTERELTGFQRQLRNESHLAAEDSK